MRKRCLRQKGGRDMKRSAILGVLALVIAVFSVSLPGDAQAGKAEYDESFVPAYGSSAGVVKGGVKVFADRTIQVSIVGATPNATYYVMGGVLYFDGTVDTIIWVPVAGPGQLELITDGKGNGAAVGWLGVFEQRYPYVVFGLTDTSGVYQYVTGVVFE
jgi:hypothetical protein